MTRHEIQNRCPELLITNYSMLEYMLMRPIERNIFEQTKEWRKRKLTAVCSHQTRIGNLDAHLI